METRNLRKERVGEVVSNKMDKTIVVAVKWKEKHPIYGTYHGDSSVEQDCSLAFNSNHRKG